ncbi:MAG: hypothetical protein V4628_12960, partial [Pseudomonadota bacterium]
ASDAIIPGAGSASGITLALAAACAGKAVAISRRHDADNAVLADLQAQLADLVKSALALAQADALQFKRHLTNESPATGDALLRTDQRILDVCRKLDTLLDDNIHLIAENMAGDWQAARELSHASRVIQEGNVQELKDAAI